VAAFNATLLLLAFVLTAEPIALRGDTLVTFLGLAVLYVLSHCLFVSQSSQALSLHGVFMTVGTA
jgi:hypothetical protein